MKSRISKQTNYQQGDWTRDQNSPTKKIPGLVDFDDEFYQISREQLTPHPHQTPLKKRRENFQINLNKTAFSSPQCSHLVVSDFLWPHGLQHTRPPCPSPTPGVYSNSCPLSWWCHSTISSAVIPFSSCFQSCPATRFYEMSQFFASHGQSTGVSALTSVLPVNIQDWFPLGWTDWISLLSKGLSRSSPMPHFKIINSSVLSFLYSPTLTSIHDYWKNHSFD